MRSGDHRIDEWVRRASAARCTIVDAPAGYGKSLLLESIAAVSARPVWLDRPDDLVATDQLAENHDATYLLDGVSTIEAASAVVVGSDVRGSETPNVEGTKPTLADRVEGLLRTAPGVQLVIAGRNLDPVVRRLGTRPASHLIEAEDLALSADQLHDLLVDRGAAAGVAAAGMVFLNTLRKIGPRIAWINDALAHFAEIGGAAMFMNATFPMVVNPEFAAKARPNFLQGGYAPPPPGDGH
ncbi:MAG: hypothetical protein AAFO29_09855, partial [Actinomycetota bacterium]